MLLCWDGGNSPGSRDDKQSLGYTNFKPNVDSSPICNPDIHNNLYPISFCNAHSDSVTDYDHHRHNHSHTHHHPDAYEHSITNSFQYAIHTANVYQNAKLYSNPRAFSDIYAYSYAILHPYPDEHFPTQPHA